MGKKIKLIIFVCFIICTFMLTIIPACSNDAQIKELESKISELEQELNNKETHVTSTSSVTGYVPETTEYTSPTPTSTEYIPPTTEYTYTIQFVGSVNSDVYHYPGCRYVKKIHPENLIGFSSSDEARSYGYRPCKVCNPPG